MAKRCFLIAQKKCPDALNATQNPPAFYKVRFLQKSRKTSGNDLFWPFCFKMGILWGFSQFFSETALCTELGFFALHSVHQDASFELSKTSFGHFFIFFIIRGDPFDFRGGKNLPAPEVEELERKEWQF